MQADGQNIWAEHTKKNNDDPQRSEKLFFILKYSI